MVLCSAPNYLSYKFSKIVNLVSTWIWARNGPRSTLCKSCWLVNFQQRGTFLPFRILLPRFSHSLPWISRKLWFPAVNMILRFEGQNSNSPFGDNNWTKARGFECSGFWVRFHRGSDVKLCEWVSLYHFYFTGIFCAVSPVNQLLLLH